MRKANIFKRILSFMLVLTLIMSGLGLDLGGITKDNDNVIEVEASTGDTSANDATCGGSSGGDSAYIDGMCYRFSLVSVDIIDTNKHTVHADKLRSLLSARSEYSILVTNDSNLKSKTIKCWSNRGKGEKYTQAVVDSLDKVFGAKCPNSGKNGNTGEHCTFNPSILDKSNWSVKNTQNNGYLGAQGPFQAFISENKDYAIKNFVECLKANSRFNLNISDTAKWVIFVEPVVISYHTRIDEDTRFALSYQDCIGSAQNGTTWSYAFTQLAYPSSTNPFKYLDSPSTRRNGKWATILKAMRSTRFSFYDRANNLGGGLNEKYESGANLDGLYYEHEGDICDTGFGIYGAGVEESGAKTSVNYTLICDGSSNTGGSISDVKASFNAVSSDSYDTINPMSRKVKEDEDGEIVTKTYYDGFNELDSDASKLRTITKSNAIGKDEPTYKTGDVATLTGRVTGISSTDWTNYRKNYIGVSSGVDKVRYLRNEEKSTKNLIKKLTGKDANATENTMITSLKSISLIPYAEAVAYSGAINLGNTYSLKLSDGSDVSNITDLATSHIFNVFSNTFNASKGVLSTSVKTTTSFDDKQNTLRNYSINSALYGLKCAKELSSLNQDNYDSTGGDKASTLGVGVTVLAKKSKVNSFLALATLNRDNGVVTCEQYANVDGSTISGDKSVTNNAKINKVIEYDVTKVGTITIPSDYNAKCFYVAVPNSVYSLSINSSGKRTGEDVFSLFSNNQELSSLNQFKSIVGSKIDTSKAIFGEITPQNVVKVGSDANSQGYSVLVLQVKGNVTKKSELKLMDYELNYIYPSMLTDGDYASLISDTSYRTLQDTTAGCSHASHHSVVYDYSANKYVNATQGEYTGNIIGKNLGLGTNKNILQFDNFTGGEFTTEENARSGHTFTNNFTNVKFSLAVNLIRSSFGDKRVVSKMTNQTSDKGIVGAVSEDYIKNNLDLTIGVVPNSSSAGASEIRNSNATVGDVLKDNFIWDVSFTHSDCSPIKYRSDLISGTVSCPGYPVGQNGWGNCGSFTWYEIVKTEVPASDFGHKVKYKVSEKAYKYQSDTLATGRTNVETIKDSLQAPENGLNSGSSLVKPYKIAVVHNSDKKDASGNEILFGFYPEVPMRSYFTSGDKITNVRMSTGDENENRMASSYVTPWTLRTIGEVQRTVKPSAMYIMRVNHKYAGTSTEVSPAIKGTTISDSTAVGTNADAVSDDKPVIYAGGDVTLKVNPEFTFNMYGYSLDIIEPTDTTLAGVGTYTNVIADSTINLKNSWGIKMSSQDVKKEFDDWVDDILHKHLGADLTLTVNGAGVDKIYRNFTTSVGGFNDIKSTADGVYSLSVVKGEFVKNGGYNKLISQIKSDYELSTDAEAESLFLNSDICKSITDAIESSNDTFNTSRKSDAIDSSRDHWYDEEVKTFVIRRFKKENIAIKNIVVNDKIDYGAAPTAEDTTASLDSYKKADAKWYLTMYLKKDGKKKTPDGFTVSTDVNSGKTETLYYHPKDYTGTGYTGSTLDKANKTGSIIINECYVNGADFVIPSASTYDMGN